jgi:transglutaminase-like putative cysteine protease
MNNLPVRFFCGVLTLALAMLVRPAWADDADRYSGTNWSFLDTKAVMAAAADITTNNYPDCDDATVDCRSERVYRADGTGESQDDVYTKVLTEKGKRNNRTVQLGFQIPYNTVSVAKLEVIKPDGSVAPVDVAANSKETIDDSQMGMNIYDPNSKILQVNIPQVEIGDVVHSITRQTTERSIIPGQYAELSMFESESYIRHTSYEVLAPAERPLLRMALRDPIAGTVTSTTLTNADQSLVYRWEVNNVPRMFDEPGMPAHENTLQHLIVSTLPDWQAVSKWYWQLSQSHLEATSADMTNRVTQLITGATNDLNKVQDLFFYVSKKIRYMGLTPEKDRPGFEPHDVCLTFDKQYGVCRDKAALLVSLLRIAGLPAYPILINVGTKRDAEVPDSFFNHAIVCVELTNGVYTLMDPTDENTRQLLPAQDCNQSYLVCKPEGERLQLSPIIPAEQNMMHVSTTGTLDNAGTLTATTELLFDGVNDNEYRDAFAHMKPDDRRRFFERDLKRVMPGAKMKSLTLLPEDMLDISTPVRATIEFSVEGMTATGSGKSVVSLPWVGKVFGIVNFILEGTGLEKRKYPLDTQVACGLDEHIALKLADGFTGAVSMPASTPVEDTGITYHRTVDFQNQALDCSRELNLKVVEFSPAQYLLLKKTLELMQYDDRKSPVLSVSGAVATETAPAIGEAAPPVASNAQILYSQKTLDVADAHSATYRVKYSKHILSYNGKVREAEIKVPFNPAVEDAKLIAGVVITKAGQRQEIGTNEINVMDQGWNAGAKRYTGGKILVANLPGVDIGSTIEVEFAVTSHGKPFLAGFEAFELPDGMDKKTFDLITPADVPVQTFVSGQPGLVSQTPVLEPPTNSPHHFQWQAADVKALPAEQQLPPDWTYAAGVGYFIGDAAAYYKEVNDTLLDRSGKSAKAAELAHQLTGTAPNKLDAVRAIRDYIATSIRDAGPSFTELPLSELSAADTTLADGYGHMADRAILYYAMLTAAGFQPEFVLASGLPPIAGITNVTTALPLPQTFNVVLVRVTVEGETYYLGDTDEYAHLGATGYNGKLAIDLATQAFAIVKAAKDGEDKTDTVYTMSLKDDGTTRVEIARYYYGGDFGEKHRFFAELPPEERRRYFQEAVSGVAQGARAVGGLTTDFNGYPGVEKFTVDIDHYCVVDGKNMYFNLPFIPSLSAPGADQRALPLFINDAMDNTTRTEIALAPRFQHPVITPSPEELTLPDGGESAVITETNSAGEIVISHEFKTTPAIVSPEDYPAMLKLESTLSKKSSRVFLLEQE